MDNKIKFALHLNGWDFHQGNRAELIKAADKVLVSEYVSQMKGSIFCPECCANLFRSPEDKEFATNGRSAYFAHARGIKTDCNLRTKRGEGKRYSAEEDAKQALLDGELVIVEGFIQTRPNPPENVPEEYDASKIEELNGQLADVPIGRHRGESFKLPSKFKTIRGLCNKFDENLYRYFFMPGSQYAVQLQDLLKNIESVSDEDDAPKIYYGRIIRSSNAGKSPQNIRMTKLKFSSPDFADFYFKLSDEKQQEKGIGDGAVGRVIIIYGKVTASGVGLCIENVGWGEFGLLPEKYENLLY